MKKNIPRIYIEDNLTPHKILFLSKKNIHYIKQVLRMHVKDILELFNNTNCIFFAEILSISKETIQVKILEKKITNIESPIHIHLGQIISQNEKMNFTIQKSIEMGVNIITPLFYKNHNIEKKNINISNKIKRWKKIAIASCQQCTRNIIPIINHPKDVFSWCQENNINYTKIIFHPQSSLKLNNLLKPEKFIKIIIGSERGFSFHEISEIIKYGFIPIKLGPRILRTETAAIAAITALQIKFGDL